MEAFINKMRRLKGIRKVLICEEAWKALSTANMAEYMKYMFKTVRKYFGEAVVVTQEVDDIISSPIVKETIINNSDCKILLDQRKYMNRFDQIQELLGLTDKEKAQILSINMANNPNRLYKEVWIGLGGTQSAVYATEVSMEEYLCYTTEETEKVQVLNKARQLGGSVERQFDCSPMKEGRVPYEDTQILSSDSRSADRLYSLPRRIAILTIVFVGMVKAANYAAPYFAEFVKGFHLLIHRILSL